MPEKITPEIFQHLVELAALEFDAEQAEYLRRELNEQLKAIQELEAIQADETVPITSHGVPYTPHIRASLREDAVMGCEEADEILAQAPQVVDRYIVVPDIPQEELT